MKAIKKLLIGLFFIGMFAAIAFGVKLVRDNLNGESYEFIESGYAITLGNKNSITSANVYPFDRKSIYNYKKLNNNISFSGDNGSVTVDDSTIIHYTNNSLLVLKDVVAIDLTKLDSSILMYYNIFKNTTIENKAGVFTIKAIDNSQIDFNSMLMRINENKYLLVGNDVRLLIDDVITDFGKYAYIEYTDGDVVQVYNETEYYKIISKGAKMVLGDVSINMDNGVIYKETLAKLTLSNLIIDYDGNVDIIPEAAKDLTLPEMKDANVDLPVSSINQSSLYDEKSGEVVEEEDPITPVYKVTGMGVSPNSINAKIEITDKDGLLTSGTHISIVENATYTIIYETDSEIGNQEIPISYTGLNPDTEYTMYAESTYKLDDISYTRNFVTKLFRTESIGIDFEKTFATEETVDFRITKDTFSDVDELKVGLYNEKGILIDTKSINFMSSNEIDETFYDLEPNKTYILKMFDIVVNGVVEENGYTENISFKTLKRAPKIGDLAYQIDKNKGGFNLEPGTIEDPDYGIISYRYEVYSAIAGSQISESLPIATINSANGGDVFVEVDGEKILRGTPYTYILVVEFNDNEKIIEYTKNLNGTMQLDGVQFPTVTWQDSFISHEQINGVILVSDPGNAIVSKTYRIVYYNSINTYKSEKITADTQTGHIPINISGLRANETYTFEVYADINLQESQDSQTADETYIGCVYVQTKEPTPLQSTLAQIENSTKGFEIQFGLDMSGVYKAANKYSCINKMDCNDNGAMPYEAATLSGLTFELYQGASTNGTLVATKKELYTPADEEAQYNSSIARKVFNPNTIVLDPEYFGIKDVSDLTARSYTLVISESYDYTEYKNNIPLEGDTKITFTLANYAQKDCAKKDTGIKVQEILNRYATNYGLEYDNKLSPTTVVGYRVMADYSDADIGTAKGVRYYLHVYNPTTKKFEQLATYKTDNFDANGALDYIIYEAGYGTNKTYDSDVFRRGNIYYWSYEVDIDSDEDGVVDMVYPKLYHPDDPDWYCGSKEVTLNKEKSTITMYPSYVAGNSAKWKYKLTDVDSSLISNNLGSYVNGNNSKTSYPEVAKGLTDWQTVEFTGISAGSYYQIKKDEKLNSKADINSALVASGYNYVPTNSINVTYSLELTDNYLIIKLDNYESRLAEIDKMGVNNITITPTNQTIKDKYGVKEYNSVMFVNGEYKINLFDIQDYINSEIKVDITTIFDTGTAGFDLGNSTVGIQKYTIDGPSFYYMNQGNTLKQTSNTYTFNGTLYPDTPSLTINKTGSTTKYNIPVIIDQTGVVYEENNIILKQFKEQNLSSSNNKVTFTNIQPGISVTSGTGRRSITSGLQFANITAKIITAGQDIQDNVDGHSCTDCIFIELWSTDANGGNAVEHPSSPIVASLSEFDNVYKLGGLVPSTNYYVKFYTYLADEEGHYVKTYLYDIDDPDADQSMGYKYPFKTNSVVTVSSVDLKFNSITYENKTLDLSYQLSSITEYDGIEYELFTLDASGQYVPCGITIPASTTLNYAMNVSIPAPPQVYPNIKWGKQFKVMIKPYGNYEENGHMVKKYLMSEAGENGYEFALDPFITPSVVISTPEKPVESLYFLISPNDPSHIIVNDEYNIVIYDDNGNKVYEEKNTKTADITGRAIATEIRLDGEKYNLVNGNNYTIEVSAKYDYNNSGEITKFQSKVFRKTIRYGEGVIIGNIAATQVNTDDESFGISLMFTQTYDLTEINKISYSIIDDVTSRYILSETKNFRVTANGNVYTYQIDIPPELVEQFTNNTVYIISLNFYIENQESLESTLVGQDDVRFVYGG